MELRVLLWSELIFTSDKKRKVTHTKQLYIYIYIYIPMTPHVLMNFRGFPPGCGDSVADF